VLIGFCFRLNWFMVVDWESCREVRAACRVRLRAV
jgi:hypothetical protein